MPCSLTARQTLLPLHVNTHIAVYWNKSYPTESDVCLSGCNHDKPTVKLPKSENEAAGQTRQPTAEKTLLSSSLQLSSVSFAFGLSPVWVDGLLVVAHPFKLLVRGFGGDKRAASSAPRKSWGIRNKILEKSSKLLRAYLFWDLKSFLSVGEKSKTIWPRHPDWSSCQRATASVSVRQSGWSGWWPPVIGKNNHPMQTNLCLKNSPVSVFQN